MHLKKLPAELCQLIVAHQARDTQLMLVASWLVKAYQHLLSIIQ